MIRTICEPIIESIEYMREEGYEDRARDVSARLAPLRSHPECEGRKCPLFDACEEALHKDDDLVVSDQA